MKKEVLSFRKVIPAGKTDVLSTRVKANATIESVRLRFYVGQEKSLQVNPFVEHKGHKIEQIIDYVETSDPYMSGDDDYFVLPVNVAVEYDDHIKVEAKNTTLNYSNATTWKASTSYAVGDKVLASTDHQNYFYECTTAGTSGTSEPAWNNTEGATTTDNTVVWTTREKGFDYSLAVDIEIDYAGGKERA